VARVANGRPTKYRPEYCEQVIAVADEGLSLTAFAGKIRVARSTINVWMEQFPEFGEAVEVHKAVRMLYLESTLLKGESSPKVTACIFALKNASDEWREKVDHAHSGAVNVNISGDDKALL